MTSHGPPQGPTRRRIAQILKEGNLKQQAIADLLGVSQGLVSFVAKKHHLRRKDRPIPTHITTTITNMLADNQSITTIARALKTTRARTQTLIRRVKATQT